MPVLSPARTCSIEDCDRPQHGRGWCKVHYLRWYRIQHGARVVPESCTVEGCDRPHLARDLCSTHYKRWRKHGDVKADVPVSDDQGWKGDAVGYKTLHDRLRRQRGKASDHACVDCGEQARDWSLVKSADAVRDAKRGLRYSLRIEDYEPRCPPCHGRYDHGRVAV